MRKGFTLVEVLVSLVVLEVGLLGVLGTLLLAARTLQEAERMEWGDAEMARIYDSLTALDQGVGQGRIPGAGGEVRWETTPTGVRIGFFVGDSMTFAIQGGRARAGGVP